MSVGSTWLQVNAFPISFIKHQTQGHVWGDPEEDLAEGTFAIRGQDRRSVNELGVRRLKVFRGEEQGSMRPTHAERQPTSL